MYDSMIGNQYIMVMNDKEVLSDKMRNGLYYHNLEDCDFVIFNTVEEKWEADRGQGGQAGIGDVRLLFTENFQAYGIYHKDFPCNHWGGLDC